MELIDRLAGILTPDERARLVGKPVLPPEVPETPTKSGVRQLPIAAGQTHEYATMYPGDPQHRAIILRKPGGFCAVYYTTPEKFGELYVDLPAEINHASQPRWRRTRPDCFLYLYLNEIREYDCGTFRIRTLKKFSDLANINGMGESDLSEDDDHIVLCSGRDVFVYEFSTARVLNIFTAPEAFDNLYLAPDNRAVVGLYKEGVQIVNSSAYAGRVAAALGHMDVASDHKGDPIAVWCNSADDSGDNRNAALRECPNGIVKIDLNTGLQTCLLVLDWSLAVHCSLPDRASFVLVSTYDPANPYSKVQYANENLKVMLDGSGVKSLGKHGADSATYEGKPRTSISPDGTRYCYDSRGGVFLGTI